MSRIGLFAFCIIVAVAILGAWLARNIRQHQAATVKYRQIAAALLAYNHYMLARDRTAGSYKLPPKAEMLWKQGNPDRFSLGSVSVSVEYHYQTNGIEWCRIFDLWRPNTNSTVWTMYELAYPTDTNLLRMAWKRKLMTVTGEP
jgi:hypothetical protein